MTPGEAAYLESVRGENVTTKRGDENQFTGHRLPWCSLQPWVRERWERIAEAGHRAGIQRDVQIAAEKERRAMRSDLLEREVQRQIQERQK